MDQARQLAAEFRRECAEDYVGLWQISRAIGTSASASQHTDRIVEVVGAILDDDNIAIGDFEEGTFVEWRADRAVIQDRLRHKLAALDREPDIGEVAWLTQRSSSDEG
jgi:hypothetical protein